MKQTIISGGQVGIPFATPFLLPHKIIANKVLPNTYLYSCSEFSETIEAYTVYTITTMVTVISY